MINVEGYKILSGIYSGRKNVIYRAFDIKNKRPVVMKTLKNSYPEPEDLKNLEYEYKVMKNMDGEDGILRVFDLVKNENSLVIIEDDFGGESLDRIIKEGKFDINEFLQLSLKIIAAIGEIHKKNIIHKDIKPHNILYNRKTGEVKIIDFGISTQLSREVQKIITQDQLEGTLLYISPEQTGRMNRSIDYRTDYYSLGITLYQMLTGKVPFEADDPMELVHAHIAKTPANPSSINSGIPNVISEIIMKLLSKNPEERYQSTYGLISDIEKCRKEQAGKGVIKNFAIGEKDIPEKISIPEKLYGRDEEIKKIMQEFDEACGGGRRLIFVSGEPGIGKSSLIAELARPAAEKKGFFIQGRYDRFRRSTPLSAVIEAFNDIIGQLLSENEETLLEWKQKILKELGDSGSVVTDVLPRLKLIIGEQAKAPELPTAESENRFNYVFQNFLKAFASRKHPLAMFLDDLQWADDASMKWLGTALTDNTLRHFIFIGSYRDNEVDALHPLTLLIKNLEREDINPVSIHLGPLDAGHIGRLLNETLHAGPDRTAEFAGIIEAKTKGNPFFVGSFIRKLYDEEMLIFDRGWGWDIGRIRESRITDNVADFMAEKVKGLPEKTGRIVEAAACIGPYFRLDTLVNICGINEEEIQEELSGAVNGGLLDSVEKGFRFSHDRVREAAYGLLDDEKKNKYHYAIGKSMLLSTKPEDIDESIFGIVQQLNSAVDIIINEKERLELAGLNLRAGLKAKSGTAYEAAGRYLLMGLSLLPPDAWKTDYRLVLGLYTEAGETEYLTGHHEKAEECFGIVLKNAENILDIVRVYSIQIPLNAGNNRLDTAIELGKKALSMLGMKMPKKANPLILVTELLKAGRLVGKLTKKKGIDALMDLPMIDDPKKLAILQLLMLLAGPVNMYAPAYTPIILLKIINFTLVNGNSVYSPFAYAAYGMILSILGKLDSSYEFGDFACRLMQKIDSKIVSGKVEVAFALFIYLWKKSTRNFITRFERSYNLSMEAGDLEYASYSIDFIFLYSMVMGENLEQLKEKTVELLEISLKIKQARIIEELRLWNQFLVSLTDVQADKFSVSGSYCNAEEIISVWKKVNNVNPITYFLIFKQMLRYLYNDYEASAEIALTAKKTLTGMSGTFHLTEHYFYQTLALLGAYSNASNARQKKYLKTIRSNLRKFRLWSGHCPENFLNKQLFIEAELAARLGKNEEAMKLYDKASEEARKNGFAHEEAMILEHAGLFYKSLGLDRTADNYLKDAYFSYQRWGARGKLHDMSINYEGLVESIENGYSMNMGAKIESDTISLSESITESPSKKSGSTRGATLDLGTVLKSSNVMAGEMKLEALLDKTIRIMMENAGAENGFLIMPDAEGRLFVQAEARLENDEESSKEEALKHPAKVMGNIPLEESLDLCQAIVRYVSKSRESVILGNAAMEGRWAGDEYVKKNKPKSILCTAIMNQGRLAAVLYLENNLITNAFPERRIELLSTLSTQAAISIENASLYGKLEDYSKNLEIKVAERTAELAAKNQLMLDELKIAQKVQSSFLPRNEALTQCGDLTIAGKYLAMEDLGGDLYDIIKIDDSRYGFLMADVSGHGVSASLMTAMAKASFNTDALSGGTTAEVCSRVNKEICSFVGEMSEHDLTVFYGTLDTATGRFEFTNAAHQPAVLYRRKSGRIERLNTLSGYIGLTLNSTYKSGVVILEPGDRLVMFTDGIVETMNSRDELYDTKRLIDMTEKCSGMTPGEYIENVLDDVNKFSGGAPLHDDRAILCIDYKE